VTGKDLDQWRDRFWDVFGYRIKGLSPGSPGRRFDGERTAKPGQRKYAGWLIDVEKKADAVEVDVRLVLNPTGRDDERAVFPFEGGIDHAPPAAMIVSNWLKPKLPADFADFAD
jgi:hypothetical protein